MAEWTTADGRQLDFFDMTDDHIQNIIKYVFIMNKVPPQGLFCEAARRGILKPIGKAIPAAEGYESPRTIMTRRLEEMDLD